MTISTIGRRGQMTIPRTIRRLLNLEEGDRVAFIQREDEVILQPLRKTLFNLRGSIPTTEVQDLRAVPQSSPSRTCAKGGRR